MGSDPPRPLMAASRHPLRPWLTDHSVAIPGIQPPGSTAATRSIAVGFVWARGSHQQSHTQAAFEPRHRATHRRGGEAAVLRREADQLDAAEPQIVECLTFALEKVDTGRHVTADGGDFCAVNAKGTLTLA